MKKIYFSVIMFLVANFMFSHSFNFDIGFGISETASGIENDRGTQTAMNMSGIPVGINMSYFFYRTDWYKCIL